MSNARQVVSTLERAVGNFRSNIDVRINSVETATKNIRSNTIDIYNKIVEFQGNMVKSEESQLAQENIIRIDQVMKEMFSNHEEVRKTVMGIVKDFDINLVRNSSMKEISDELWLTSSRYWLSFALIAISCWVNNYKEIAYTAVAECFRKDPIKSSLFFCLFNLRFGRNEVAKKWLYEYLRTLDPAKMQIESAVLLQAYLKRVFGTDKELEYKVSNIIKEWIDQLKQDEATDSELTEAYVKYISNLNIEEKCEYKGLEAFCSEFKEIEAYYKEILKFRKLIQELDIYDIPLEEQNAINYKNRVDAVLLNLISKYDKEELELKKQKIYFQFIRDNNGDVEVAREQFEEYERLENQSFNVGKHMIKWALYDDIDQTDIYVKKFGLQNTKTWYLKGLQDWSVQLFKKKPMEYHLAIDKWRGISNGADQEEMVASMNRYFEDNKFQIIYVTPVNIFLAITTILSIALAFKNIYFLIGTVVSVISLVALIIKARKEFPIRVAKAIGNLNICMEELANFEKHDRDNREQKDILEGKITYL